MMKKIIKILAKVAVVCLAVIGIVAILFITIPLWPGRHWPEVKNSQSLRVDCAALLNNHEPRSIPKAQWPQSVQSLKPVAVHCDENYVVITISGGGIGAAWGFVVFPNQTIVLSERLLTSIRIWGTGQEGVFKCQTIE